MTQGPLRASGDPATDFGFLRPSVPLDTEVARTVVTAAKLLLSSESPSAQPACVTEPEGRRGPHGGPRPLALLSVQTFLPTPPMLIGWRS